MFLLKLIRVLAVLLFLWLICYWLYSVARKAVSRQVMRNAAEKTHRKFVKSSVVEGDNESDDKEKS